MTSHSVPRLARPDGRTISACHGPGLSFGIPTRLLAEPPSGGGLLGEPGLVYAGSGDSVAVHVNASDADNDSLTYSYTATGGAWRARPRGALEFVRCGRWLLYRQRESR